MAQNNKEESCPCPTRSRGTTQKDGAQSVVLHRLTKVKMKHRHAHVKKLKDKGCACRHADLRVIFTRKNGAVFNRVGAVTTLAPKGNEYGILKLEGCSHRSASRGRAA